MVAVVVAAAVSGAVLGAFGIVAFTIAGSAIVGGAVVYAGLAAAQYLIAQAFIENVNVGVQRPDTRKTITAAAVAARWWFGECRAAGQIVHLAEESDRGETLWIVYAVSEAPIESLEGIWINSEYVKLDANPGHMLRPRDDSQYRDKIWLHPVLDGTASPNSLSVQGFDVELGDSPAFFQSAISDLETELERNNDVNGASINIPEWGADKQLLDVAHVIVRLYQPPYNDAKERFWTAVPEIQFHIKGMKFATASGTAEQYRSNAADVYYWWLHNRRAIPHAGIDQTAYQAARTVCEQDVTLNYPPAYSDYPSTVKRYTVNGLITAEDDAERVEAELDFAMSGNAVDFDGRIFLKPGTAPASIHSIQPSETISIESVSPAQAIQNRVNKATMTLPQARHSEFSELRLPAVADDAAIELDGETIEKDFGARAFVNDEATALRLLLIALRRARAGTTVSLTLMPGLNFRNMTIQPADVVSLTNPDYGFTDTKFRVASANVNSDFSINLGLEEYSEDTYDDTAQLPPISPVVNLPPAAAAVPPQAEMLAGSPVSRATIQTDGTIRSEILVGFKQTGFAGLCYLRGEHYSAERVAAAGEGVIEFDVPDEGNYQGRLWLLGKTGIRGPANEFSVDVSWDTLIPSAPSVISSRVFGDTAIVNLREESNRDIAGIEIRYSVVAAESNATPETINESNWNQRERVDVVSLVASVNGGSMTAKFTVEQSNKYRFFGRYTTRAGRQSAIAELFSAVMVARRGNSETIAAHLGWEGSFDDCAVLNAAEFPNGLLVHDVETARLNAMTFADWNGANGWPFSDRDDTAIYIVRQFNWDSATNIEVILDWTEHIPAGATYSNASTYIPYTLKYPGENGSPSSIVNLNKNQWTSLGNVTRAIVAFRARSEWRDSGISEMYVSWREIE